MQRDGLLSRSVILLMPIFWLVLLAGEHGELLGQQRTGPPAPRRTGSAAQPRQGNAAAAPGLEAVGSIVDEEARFLRGNRGADDFVGRDTSEGRAFVGTQQAATDGAIRSAIEDVSITMLPDVNRQQQPVIPPRMQLNAPRLQVGFARSVRPAGEVSRQLTTRLQSKLAAAGSNPIAVSMADGEALLRGEVASARDRKLAELLLRLEPGVARVRNELQIAPGSAEPLPQLPPPLRSQAPRG